jgi:hypothetical protein
MPQVLAIAAEEREPGPFASVWATFTIERIRPQIPPASMLLWISRQRSTAGLLARL